MKIVNSTTYLFFFKGKSQQIFVVQSSEKLQSETLEKLHWLLEADFIKSPTVEGKFLGARKEMLTPWSTNAVEITQNMGISGLERIEVFTPYDDEDYDSMLLSLYENLNQEIFESNIVPEAIINVENIGDYNQKEGLALSDDEVLYLENVSEKIGRKLTDSEVFGFSQVNSEHCRHKIFNGQFIIDGEEKEHSLFQLIKQTAKENPNKIVSAYKDNVSFIAGSEIEQFAPSTQDKADFFETKNIKSVQSLKAETHNFPTTVEPFNGAATGAGGEIRDRMSGGKGSIPIAGTAVYMTAYPRSGGKKDWVENLEARKWLYQSPTDILIKASNGASDFGNKFGQPLINGSLLTFEHFENGNWLGYDKVIMQAGGIGFAKLEDAKKELPKKGDKIVVLGGDNYRIGMGGSSVASVATGEFNNAIELNAIQRSNPEMQKRVANVIRALSEASENPIVSIHDHGAGGHLNSLSELVEETGGTIDLDKLPVGDKTLSAKEIIGNESQERIGLVIKETDLPLLQQLSERELAPMYIVGEITEDMVFKFESKTTGAKPMDLNLEDMFGKPPKTVLKDATQKANFAPLEYDWSKIGEYVEDMLQLEAVASKDWLTNKVDRSVSGKVACQQNVGELQMPVSDLGAMALDFRGKTGLATALGHAPIPSLIDPVKGARLAIAESLTNLVFAPLTEELKSVSLSANWMWAAKNKGEDARLYEAVQSVSEFAIDLGINIPTGKDSLSMVQKYSDGKAVKAPGTVIITASGEVSDIKKIITPALEFEKKSKLLYIDFSFNDDFPLGGSSFAQILNQIGTEIPEVSNNGYFKMAFNSVQELISKDLVLAGHDISAGGMITTLAEMCFTCKRVGMNINLDELTNGKSTWLLEVLFCEKPSIILQVKNDDQVNEILTDNGIRFAEIGNLELLSLSDYYSEAKLKKPKIKIKYYKESILFDVEILQKFWLKTSIQFQYQQVKSPLSYQKYFVEYLNRKLHFDRITYLFEGKYADNYKGDFSGKLSDFGLSFDREKSTGTKAAIIREKGVNGDREMAYAMWIAGFDVKDVHMTDLISGKENLEDVNFIVFVGGFSNSDVLGSAKGWAGAFKYNPKAKKSLDNFYKREDTLSLGVCNGCQLMVELGLIYPEKDRNPKLEHNVSGKFESDFLNVLIEENDSVMLKSLGGSNLGIWIAHGEGKFVFPKSEENYAIPVRYVTDVLYDEFTDNKSSILINGSMFQAAAIVSDNGRHLAMMPHLERAIFPWQCGYYPKEKRNHEMTPWLEAFVNARKWVESELKMEK